MSTQEQIEETVERRYQAALHKAKARGDKVLPRKEDYYPGARLAKKHAAATERKAAARTRPEPKKRRRAKREQGTPTE